MNGSKVMGFAIILFVILVSLVVLLGIVGVGKTDSWAGFFHDFCYTHTTTFWAIG